MKPIGGYFELETHPGKEYYPELIRLNTGRNCLEYILRARQYTKVYIPYFTCDVILEPLKKLGVNYSFYHIDQRFDPIIDFEIHENEALLYTNYFGLKGQTVERLADEDFNLIIDNAQAFFDKPLKGIDTFYSPRKYFGIPDGGYLSTTKTLNLNLETDISIDRFSHLLKRVEYGPEEGYMDFQNNDNSLIGQPIKKMSLLTQKLLASIDYETIVTKRRKNFEILHSKLLKYNEVNIDINPNVAPLIYPFYSSKMDLREKLIQNKVYIPKFWPSISKELNKQQFEWHLTNNLLPIPIDQRYGFKELNYIIKILNL